MTLTPVPPQLCTGCAHPPHEHACEACACGVATPQHADHHTTSEQLTRIEGVVEHLVTRVEYLIGEVLRQHEYARRVPELVDRIEAIEARLAAAGNSTGEILR